MLCNGGRACVPSLLLIQRTDQQLWNTLRTSYRWCWWLRNAAVSYEMGRQVEGTVEADDLYHNAGNKGQAKGGGTKVVGWCSKRGDMLLAYVHKPLFLRQ